MSVRLGDTFLVKGHLLIVISDPQQNADQVVLACLSTREGGWRGDTEGVATMDRRTRP